MKLFNFAYFFKRFYFLLLIVIVFLILGLINFKNSIPKMSLDLTSSDAVIVLTGDRGKRIEQGYKLIDQTNFNKMPEKFKWDQFLRKQGPQ